MKEKMTPPHCLTVTVGIPAHNEAHNIEYLLKAILKQKQPNFKLEKVIVLCDGCSDKTEDKALKIARNNNKVIVLNDNKRKGKTERLNELYQMNTSDVLVTIDGDVIPQSLDSVSHLIEPLFDKNTEVSAGNNQPYPATTLAERIINAWYDFWYIVRKDINGGNSVHNSHGAFTAIKDNFAKSLVYPHDIIATAQYLFFFTLKKKKKFHFTKEAIVYFYSPTSFKDFFLQTNRYGDDKQKYISAFGDWIENEYVTPFQSKVKAILTLLLTHPLQIPFMFIFYIMLKLNQSKSTSIEGGRFWKTVASTKRTFRYAHIA